MAADRIEVNTQLLGRLVSDMREDAASIRNYVQEIYQNIRELDAMWDGPANQAFNLQFEKDRAKLLDICSEIENYIDKVKDAQDEYNRCESAVADMINAIRI